MSLRAGSLGIRLLFIRGHGDLQGCNPACVLSIPFKPFRAPEGALVRFASAPSPGGSEHTRLLTVRKPCPPSLLQAYRVLLPALLILFIPALQLANSSSFVTRADNPFWEVSPGHPQTEAATPHSDDSTLCCGAGYSSRCTVTGRAAPGRARPQYMFAT